MREIISLTTLILGCALFVFYSGYLLLMLKFSKSAKLEKKSINLSPSVSVLIPTYNEESTIIQKLKNLVEQNYPLEVVIVDSASKDRTVELVEKFMKEEGTLKIKLLKEKERRGIASAENMAFPHCSGEIVVLSDADSTWEKGALRKALSNFNDKEIGAVFGRQVLLNTSQNIITKSERSYRNIFEILRIGESNLDSTPFFDGEIGCIKNELIEKVDEDSMADDAELAIKIRKKGFKVILDPNVVFYEYAPPTFRSRLYQKVRRGQGLIQVFWKEKKILFNPKYGKFGLIIFPAEFIMHLVCPTLVFLFLFFLIYSLASVNIHFTIVLGGALVTSYLLFKLKRIDLANVALNFLTLNFALVVGLAYQLVGKSQHKWRKIDTTRELWREKAQLQQLSL